ncbi:MAG: cytochrome c, partial [Verrucomicrobiaceae bacterium]
MLPVSRSLPLLASCCLLVAGCRAATGELASAERGEKIYVERCAMCHQVTGQGVPPVFPPLAGSEWVSGDRSRLIKVLAEGLSG